MKRDRPPKRRVLFDTSEVLDGAADLAEVVSRTLGPEGATVLLEHSGRAPLATKDGVTVADYTAFRSRARNLGAKVMRDGCRKTNDLVGDGTTTTAVLARSMLAAGRRFVAAGADPIAFQRGLHAASTSVVDRLRGSARACTTAAELHSVCLAAANGDEEVAGTLSAVLERVGGDGLVEVDDGHHVAMQYEIVEGMEIDSGFATPAFGDRPTLSNVLVILLEGRIDRMELLVPLMERAVREKRSLLVVAGGFGRQVLDLLIGNHRRGVLHSCAVKAPGFGPTRRATLDDLAVLTGGMAVLTDLGLSHIPGGVVGMAKRVDITEHTTRVQGGAGSRSAIGARVTLLRDMIADETSDYGYERAQARLARLVGASATVRVGAASDAARAERRARVEDALAAGRAAIRSGVVDGAGVGLAAAAAELSQLVVLDHELAAARSAVYHACHEPMRQIFATILPKRADTSWIAPPDPAEVVWTALQNATATAGLLLTCEAAIIFAGN